MHSQDQNQPRCAEASFNANNYWEERYKTGGDSGHGSKGYNYIFKRDYINSIVKKYNIQKVIDFGCGDGTQIAESVIPEYFGIDVSPTIVKKCQELYKNRSNWQFAIADQTQIPIGDLTISIDVIYHVTNNKDFHDYLSNLFKYTSKYVLLYSNYSARESEAEHIKFRNILQEITDSYPNWLLLEKIPHPLKMNFGFILYTKK